MSDRTPATSDRTPATSDRTPTMTDRTPTTSDQSPPASGRPNPVITWVLVAAVVVLFAGSFMIGRATIPDTEFGGADAQAVEVLEEDGVEPWFSPLFEPASGEIESGIFAFQAALGGAVLGWALGRLQSRSRIRELEDARADAPALDSQAS